MKRVVLVLLLLLLCLSACTPQGVYVHNGENLSPEEQQSLYDERAEQDTLPQNQGTDVVYWTSGGSKYHKDPACSYLKNAKQVFSGTLARAANYGADSPCSRCAGE